MEADWEVEIGGEAPVLHADWPGFVDFRLFADKVNTLQEVQQFSPLGLVLGRLNASQSPVWTAKCDVWALGSLDPYEFDALPEESLVGLACYIDLLATDTREWATPVQVTGWCRLICARLKTLAIRACRVDLVVRAAILSCGEAGLGVTAYVSAAGREAAAARARLADALVACADAICGEGNLSLNSKLQ